MLEDVEGQPIAVVEGVLQGGADLVRSDVLADVGGAAEIEQRHGTDVPPAGEHEREPAGVVRQHPVEGPAWFVASVVEVGRTIEVVRCSRIEGVRHDEVDARNLHVVQPPLHFGITQILAARPVDFHHRHIVGLAVGMRDGTAQLGGLPAGRIVGCALAPGELAEDRVDPAHVAVLLELKHVAGAEFGMEVFVAVLQEVPDGLDAALFAPAGDTAVESAAPRLGQSILVLVPSRDLFLAGKRELPSDQGPLPVDAAFIEHPADLGAPVAARLRLVVEEAGDVGAEVLLEPLVVRLVDGLQVPVDSLLAGAVHQVTPAHLAGLPGELHDLPASLGGVPGELAIADLARQIQEAGAVDAVCGHPSREGGDEARSSKSVGLVELRALDHDALGHEALAAVGFGDPVTDFAAGPPLLIEDPHGESLALGGFQANFEVPVPARSQPVVVRARLRDEAAVAALGDLGHVVFQEF